MVMHKVFHISKTVIFVKCKSRKRQQAEVSVTKFSKSDSPLAKWHKVLKVTEAGVHAHMSQALINAIEGSQYPTSEFSHFPQLVMVASPFPPTMLTTHYSSHSHVSTSITHTSLAPYANPPAACQ